VARVCVPVADSCHCTKVRGKLVTMGRLYRRPHQSLLFKKIIKKVFFLKKSTLFWFLIGETDIKLTLRNFEFSYQNVEKYQKKIFWSGFDMLEKNFDPGKCTLLIGVWPIYRSNCIPITYQDFKSNRHQFPNSLSGRAMPSSKAWLCLADEQHNSLQDLHVTYVLFIYCKNDSLPAARRHGVFGYPKQSATVSIGSVLKWRARSRTHAEGKLSE
jgi:hypothetical protein